MTQRSSKLLIVLAVLFTACSTFTAAAAGIDLTRTREKAVSFEAESIEAMHHGAASAMLGPERLGRGWEFGPDKEVMTRLLGKLAAFDAAGFAERLNAYSPREAIVDGTAIRFFVEPGSGTNPPVVLLLHGWPHNVAAFLPVIDRLAHPERFGGDAQDGVTVIAPSYPNYPLSDRLVPPPGPRAIAAMMTKLMTGALGIERFYVQGGDWGSHIGAWMALEAPEAVAGLHLNHVFVRRPEDAIGLGPVTRAPNTSSKDLAFFDAETAALQGSALAYLFQLAERPQSLGWLLAGDVLATTAWYVDKYYLWADRRRQSFADGWSDVELLDQLALMLLTGSEETSTWIYAGFAAEDPPILPAGSRVTVPTAYAAFADTLNLPLPRNTVARSYNLVSYTEPTPGAHFPMVEAPEVFAADVLAFVNELESSAETGDQP